MVHICYVMHICATQPHNVYFLCNKILNWIEQCLNELCHLAHDVSHFVLASNNYLFSAIINAGIRSTHVCTFLSSFNIRLLHQSTLFSRQKQAFASIIEIAEDSFTRAFTDTITNWLFHTWRLWYDSCPASIYLLSSVDLVMSVPVPVSARRPLGYQNTYAIYKP